MVVATTRVELFGVPRLLVGRRAVEVTGATLGEALSSLARSCPELGGRVLDPATGWPVDGYILVVDQQFTRRPDHRVEPGTSILLVASSAGGAPAAPAGRAGGP